MSKGISQTLWIVITAVVIIVVALVMLTIFGTNIRTVASIADARSVCLQTCAVSCATGVIKDSVPPMWYVKTVNYNGLKSCYEIEKEAADSSFTCKCP